MKTLEGEYTLHEIPHLIADINAPRPESERTYKLKCRLIQLKVLED